MKDFTLHPEALELKQLGFDEPCIAWYAENKELQIAPDTYKKWSSKACNNSNIISVFNSDCITAPTYSQAFRFFREKHNLESFIVPSVNEQDKTIYRFAFGNLSKSVKYDFEDKIDYQFEEYDTYEEAELACLKHLIKTVKENENRTS